METPSKGYNLTLPVNNFLLSYDDIGDSLVPILFLHGFPFDKSMWQGQLDALKADYRLIACDIRGFGKSTDEGTWLSIDLFADDLILFMDALGLSKVIICGLSMGGFIALNAVDRYPDRFGALILCDTQCIADTAEIKAHRYKTIGEIERNGPTGFNADFIQSVFHETSLSDKKSVIEQVAKVVEANSTHIITQGLLALAERSDRCSALANISVPTLILCGRSDQVTPLSESLAMHAAIQGAVLEVIEMAGHVSNLEQAAVFNTHLHAFLGTLTGLNFEHLNGETRMA